MNVWSASQRYNLFYVSPENLYSTCDIALHISYYICFSGIFLYYIDIDRYNIDSISGILFKFIFFKYLLATTDCFTFQVKVHPLGMYRGAASFTPTYFLNKYAALFYSSFNLLLSLFYTDRLVSIILFNYYLNSTTILSCLCVYSLCNYFVNLIFICRNNNLSYAFISFYIRH